MTEDDALRLHVQANRAFDDLWSTTIKITGCIACAENDIRQRLGLAVTAEEGRVLGEQPAHDVHLLPVKRDGMALYCTECRP